MQREPHRANGRTEWLPAETTIPRGGCRYVPPFPALPSTLVSLELLLGSPSVDLGKLLTVVRADPGFAAEVLRLGRRRHQPDTLSLQACLVHLGQSTLRRATRIVPVWTRSLTQSQIWMLRGRLKRAKLVALGAEATSALIGDIPSETAYLAGLLHDLPALTCFTEGCSCTVTELRPNLESWNLPDCLAEVMRWHRQPWNAPAEHSLLAHRIAAVRAWVNEIQLSSNSLSAGWLERLSGKNEWLRVPNRGQLLHILADRLDAWRLWNLD